MFQDAFRLAIREIRRNVLRSFLTMLGIVIGVAAVIVMVTIGGGATARVTEQISLLGSHLLTVSPGQFRGPGGVSGDADRFDLDDAIAIEREIGGVRAVAPVALKYLTAIYGNQNWSTTVNGSDNQFLVVRDWTIRSGREFTPSELRSGKAVCILGATTKKELFGGGTAIGQSIRLGSLSCRVIGVLRPKGQSVIGTDQDDLVIIPLRTCWRRVTGNQEINLIQISAVNDRVISKVRRDVERLMRERRDIAVNEEDDFSVRDVKELVTILTGTTKVLTTLLGAVAAVSLLVGGVGIMNIMLVSVTERTREIGIRLAIGALEREVLLQFLVEAVVLSSLGGLLGVLVAIGSSILLANLLQVPFLFNLEIVLLSFTFSAAVGILFGYFPARKAASLNPIEALRRE